MRRDILDDERVIRRLRTTAFVIWLCVVWGHSLMPGDASSTESSLFVFLVRPFFGMVGCHDEMLMTLFIRKAAHFTEYAILGSLALRMAWSWYGKTWRAFLLAAFLWVVVPMLDEAIQLLVPGRAGSPTDVLIDLAGGLVGIVVAFVLMRTKVPDG